MPMINAKPRRTKVNLLSTFVLLIAAEVPLSTIPLDAESATSAPCSAPEYRQFDFWLGDWDSFDIVNSSKDARVRVGRILEGCVIHEDYQNIDGHKGESFSIYDASRKVWHQSWFTNRGQLLIIEGKMEDGAMVLAGTDRTTSGEDRHVRGIWKPVDGGVRETAFTSTDGGKTWKVVRSYVPPAQVGLRSQTKNSPPWPYHIQKLGKRIPFTDHKSWSYCLMGNVRSL
jgi:hypothetical protein